MAQETAHTQFHYGFYAAMKVEYDIIHAGVTYEQEIQLGEEPIRLDFLIIKKDADVVLTDPIGEFFGTVNIFEYKSPEDGLSIDDFYKAMGYSFIYKGYDRKVDELPITDMTLTIVRHTYPRELMKALRHEGFEVVEQHPGIYRINGNTSNLRVQIVVSSKLPHDEYDGLRLLSKGCTKDTVVRYIEKIRGSENENVKTNVETVINICLKLNKGINKQIKEDEAMQNTLRDILKEDFDAAEERGEERGVSKEKERVAKDMLKKNLPLSLIEEISKLSEDTIRSFAQTLGVAVV